jgi:hypothetical protein
MEEEKEGKELPKKKGEWVMEEVVGEDGVVRMEERFYTPQGGSLRKKQKNDGTIARRRKIPELEVLLGDLLAEEKNGVPAAKLILAALRKKALSGDLRAIELLMDRAWGKAKQEININKTEKQFIMIGTKRIEF